MTNSKNLIFGIGEFITGPHLRRIAIALWWSVSGVVVLVVGLAHFPQFVENAGSSRSAGIGLNIYLLWLLGTFLWMFMKGFLTVFRKKDRSRDD